MVVTLAEYPADRIVIRCGRKGVYDRERAIQKHGGEMGLPTFLSLATADCESKRTLGLQARAAAYPALTLDSLKPSPYEPLTSPKKPKLPLRDFVLVVLYSKGFAAFCMLLTAIAGYLAK